LRSGSLFEEEKHWKRILNVAYEMFINITTLFYHESRIERRMNRSNNMLMKSPNDDYRNGKIKMMISEMTRHEAEAQDVTSEVTSEATSEAAPMMVTTWDPIIYALVSQVKIIFSCNVNSIP
jgi:hypothetical protein